MFGSLSRSKIVRKLRRGISNACSRPSTAVGGSKQWPLCVQRVIAACDYLMTEGVQVDGLFRASGDDHVVRRCFRMFCVPGDFEKRMKENRQQVYPVEMAYALKHYLLRLEEPLCTYSLYPAFLSLSEVFSEQTLGGESVSFTEQEHKEFLLRLKPRMALMPPENRVALRCLIQLCLSLCDAYVPDSDLTIVDCAIAFASTVIRPSTPDPDYIVSVATQCRIVIMLMHTYAHWAPLAEDLLPPLRMKCSLCDPSLYEYLRARDCGSGVFCAGAGAGGASPEGVPRLMQRIRTAPAQAVERSRSVVIGSRGDEDVVAERTTVGVEHDAEEENGVEDSSDSVGEDVVGSVAEEEDEEEAVEEEAGDAGVEATKEEMEHSEMEDPGTREHGGQDTSSSVAFLGAHRTAIGESILSTLGENAASLREGGLVTGRRDSGTASVQSDTSPREERAELCDEHADPSCVSAQKRLCVGMQAPLFEGHDEQGALFSVKDTLQQGKKLVVFFYPKAFSPACSAQNKAFRQAYMLFKFANVKVVGISSDTITCHRRFVDQLNLPFHMISDKDGHLRALYGLNSHAIANLNSRTTFIINTDGTIEHIYSNRILAAEHVMQSLAAVSYLLQRECVSLPPVLRQVVSGLPSDTPGEETSSTGASGHGGLAGASSSPPLPPSPSSASS